MTETPTIEELQARVTANAAEVARLRTEAAEYVIGGTPYKVHPAANLFPLMEGEEFDALVEDIREHGLNDPVWLWRPDKRSDYVLLDGRNRIRACEAAGVQVRHAFWRGDDAISFIVSENLRRRQLTTGQRSAVGSGIKKLRAEEAAESKRRGAIQAAAYKERCDSGMFAPSQVKDNGPSPGRKPEVQARDLAGAEVGVSGRSIDRFERVQREDPELAEQVAAGKVPLGRAVAKVCKPRRSRPVKPVSDEGNALRRQAAQVLMCLVPLAEALDRGEQGDGDQWDSPLQATARLIDMLTELRGCTPHFTPLTEAEEDDAA